MTSLSMCHISWKRCRRQGWRNGEEGSLETHLVGEKTTLQEYSALAKQLCPNIQVEFIAKNEIDQQSAFLDAKWEGAMAVPQTHRVHCIQASGADEVKVADTSDEIEKSFRVCRICNTNVTPPTNQQLNRILQLKTMPNLSYQH